ncbi:hypothetical protein AN958_07722 [Leucoagaricus sp. SymC.cos]|nr:hypothetical protein AN958_07722 [Leucoagaricus sp. SymC.cos]
MFTELHEDILIDVLHSLSPFDLAALAQTCKASHKLVSRHGWPYCVRSRPRPSYSLSSSRSRWTSLIHAKYDVLTDEAWKTQMFVARPLSNPWSRKNAPALAISTNRLVVASGNDIHCYKFGVTSSCNETSAPPVTFEGSYSLLGGHEGFGIITAITHVSSHGHADTFFIAFRGGIIEYIILSPSAADADDHHHQQLLPLTVTRTHATTLTNGDFSESLSSTSQFLLSVSSNGSATLADHRDLTGLTDTPLPQPPSPSSHQLEWSSSLNFQTPSWASLLCPTSSTPYAAFGISNPTAPLPIYYLPDLSLPSSGIPSVLLTTENFSSSSSPSTSTASPSAVYGLSQAPPSSAWGSSPDIVVGGWHDGKVRCYDLRVQTSSHITIPHPYHSLSSPTLPSSTSVGAGRNWIEVPALKPTLSLHNPRSHGQIYSVSCGGGYSSYITAGTDNSILSFWDVRSRQSGWSVHAPGNDPSPIHSVVLESSRCFGATESRPFVYDFGPGVTIDTYPPITPSPGDKLKLQGNGIDYHVRKYTHN